MEFMMSMGVHYSKHPLASLRRNVGGSDVTLGKKKMISNSMMYQNGVNYSAKDMESLYKRKRLDYTLNSVKECTTCTYTQNIFPSIETNGSRETLPLLIQNKLKRSSSDSSDHNDVSPPRYLISHGANHANHDSNHYPSEMPHVTRDLNNNVTPRDARTYISDKVTKSPPKKKLWPTDAVISEQANHRTTEPPLLIKSCPVEHTRPLEAHHRKERIPQKCVAQGPLNDKYRHPIFASTEDFKKDVGGKWEKHLKAYGGLDHAQYMQCLTLKKNGYLNTYCSKSMLNKNIYIDCGRPVEAINGDKDGYKGRHNDKSPLTQMHHDSLYALNRQHSTDGSSSLLSTTSLKSQSIISVSSRDGSRTGSPPEEIRDSEHNKSRSSSMPHATSLVNFKILEKHEGYIVVYAEINGKRYEGCLSIERKPP